MNRLIIAALAFLFAFPAQAACTQNVYNLFGPESRYGYALEYNLMQWGWPGSALTASTQYIRFDQIPPIEKATLLVVWWPLDNAWLNLIAFDGGPANIMGVTQFHTPDRSPSNPIPVRVDITQQMQSLHLTGVGKYLGYQLHGHLKVGVVRLELCTQ